MKLSGIIPCFAIAIFSSVPSFAQSTIADWTFETSQPAIAGPVGPKIGSGSATAWAVGDFWQFQVSTMNYQDLLVSCDQACSNTGSGRGNFSYSTDGINFTVFSSGYTILANASPNPVWNATTPHRFIPTLMI